MIQDVIKIKLLKKIFVFLLILTVIFSFSGCNKDKGENRVMRYDVKHGTPDIDPQFSTSDTAKKIIANTFEGLFRYNSKGEIENLLAESYSLSPDKKIYTFNIKKDVKWSNGEPLTAKDFEYAFKRMFNLQALSPYAVNYTSIKNAYKILNGQYKSNMLGVSCPDKYTLKIELESPNPYFISLLTHNAAMPCNEKFLVESKGRYGLDKDHIIFNGPFVLKAWDEEEIRIRRNNEYYDKKDVICAGVNFYIDRENPKDLFFKNKSDCCFLNESDIEQAEKDKKNIIKFENTSLQLIFNQENKFFSNNNIRKAFGYAVDISKIESDEFFTVEKNLIPDIINTPIGKYRDIAGDVSYSKRQSANPKEMLALGLEELEVKKMGRISILLPDNVAGKKAGLELQKVWAKGISVYVNFEFLPESELMKRVKSSDYQIALVPSRPLDDSAVGIISAFSSENELNYCNFKNPEFDKIIYKSMHTDDIKTSVELIKKSEQYLIDEAVVLPVFTSNQYFAMNKDVSDIEVSVYEGTCFFKNARRID